MVCDGLCLDRKMNKERKLNVRRWCWPVWLALFVHISFNYNVNITYVLPHQITSDIKGYRKESHVTQCLYHNR